MSEFPITLLFPPQAHFTQPYMGLACLKAWLQEHGFDDVEQVDASVLSYDHFLSADYVRWATRRSEARSGLAKFESQDELSFGEMDAYRAAAEVAVSGNILADRVDGAKAVLRGKGFFDPALYIPAARTLFHSLRIVSAAWAPTKLTPHNFTMAYAIDRSEDVLAATQDEDQNPYISFYRECILPDLIRRNPRVLGISVIYGSQLIPALTLGRLVKEALPDCHITTGGGFLAYIGEKLLAAPALSACFDSIVFHEGEKPLEELCVALRDGGDLKGIPSLGFFSTAEDGTVTGIKNMSGHPISLNEAPMPDFDGTPFDTYFSPEVVLAYDVNRGCYYGECSFCTLPTVIGPGYRTRSAETIASHVKSMREKYGFSSFNFITDCLPPGMIQELPDQLVAQESGIKWWCDARVEPRAYTKEGAERLYASGCRKLLFGFETAVPRLLKLMKKGQSPSRTLEVANNCNDAGISVTFYAMVGFPSETVEEARQTLAMLQENAAGTLGPNGKGGPIREVSLQTFHVDEVAEVFRDPTTYGLELLPDPNADLQLYYDFNANAGMSQLEASEMFDEIMAGLRASLPLFHEDTFFYFTQKSHYFLHLANGFSPDEFIEHCRAAGIARQNELEAASLTETLRRLEVVPDCSTRAIPFSYTEVARRLAHPLARAARPDFLTGTFLADLEREAADQLGSLCQTGAKKRVLAYSPGSTEFVELSIDGEAVLRALEDAGSYGKLLAAMGNPEGPDVERLDTFVHELHKLGLLFLPSTASTLTSRTSRLSKTL
jgi:anaerobic magnesium-protoporphyrin IX monomethyl ester cyclase